MSYNVFWYINNNSYSILQRSIYYYSKTYFSAWSNYDYVNERNDAARRGAPVTGRVSRRDLLLPFRSLLLTEHCFAKVNHRVPGLFVADHCLDCGRQRQVTTQLWDEDTARLLTSDTLCQQMSRHVLSPFRHQDHAEPRPMLLELVLHRRVLGLFSPPVFTVQPRPA